MSCSIGGLGIPISLALVYIGSRPTRGARGVRRLVPRALPAARPERRGRRGGDPIILDPFDGGRRAGRARLPRAAAASTSATTRRSIAPLLDPCTARQSSARMLNNLKRTYVELRSFPHARRSPSCCSTVDPTFGSESARPRAARLSPRRFPGGAARSRTATCGSAPGRTTTATSATGSLEHVQDTARAGGGARTRVRGPFRRFREFLGAPGSRVPGSGFPFRAA